MKIYFLFLAFLTYSLHSFAQSEGDIRYSSGEYEFYDGASWRSMDNGTTSVACSNQGQLSYKSSGNRYEYCGSDSEWHTMDTGTNDGTCSSAGEFSYDSTGDVMRFCNGTNWRRTYASVDVTPNSIDWSDLSTSTCTAYDGSSQTITGINQTITLRVEYTTSPAAGVLDYVDINSAGRTYMNLATSSYDFTVSSGDTVYFEMNRTTGGGSVSHTIRITNQSDGGAVLDTYTASTTAGCGP